MNVSKPLNYFETLLCIPIYRDLLFDAFEEQNIDIRVLMLLNKKIRNIVLHKIQNEPKIFCKIVTNNWINCFNSNKKYKFSEPPNTHLIEIDCQSECIKHIDIWINNLISFLLDIPLSLSLVNDQISNRTVYYPNDIVQTLYLTFKLMNGEYVEIYIRKEYCIINNIIYEIPIKNETLELIFKKQQIDYIILNSTPYQFVSYQDVDINERYNILNNKQIYDIMISLIDLWLLVLAGTTIEIINAQNHKKVIYSKHQKGCIIPNDNFISKYDVDKRSYINYISLHIKYLHHIICIQFENSDFKHYYNLNIYETGKNVRYINCVHLDKIISIIDEIISPLLDLEQIVWVFEPTFLYLYEK
jgi:hypothetical protein